MLRTMNTLTTSDSTISTALVTMSPRSGAFARSSTPSSRACSATLESRLNFRTAARNSDDNSSMTSACVLASSARPASR